MQEKTYIIGHKNPDVDSICSALAYAKYKELMGEKGFCAARCGNSNSRIDRVLKKFDAHLPKFVGDVRLRASDVMKTDVIKMFSDVSCHTVMEAIDKHDIRAIPLVNDADELLGEVSVFDLGAFFIPHPKSAKEVRRVTATLNDIVKTLNATTHCIFEPEKPEDMYVRIGAMEVSTFGSFIHKEQLRPEQNLIVVGDRFDIQIKAVQMGVRAIIITGGYNIDEAVLEMARAKNVSVLSCPYDSATTALLVRMATRALPLMRKDVTILRSDYPLSKISAKAKTYFGKTIYVCAENGKLQGVFSNSDLINTPKRKLVLVDHNELSQAVRGAEEAEIVEVIDHHRLGMTPTQAPILFLNKPVGSTCTIISSMFRRSGLKIDKRTAGLLCSGIVCDTLNLKSPTATSEDADEIAELSKIIGMSGAQLADYIFSGDSVILSNSADDVILADCKIYHEGDVDFSVSQIEELDFSNFNSKLADLRESLERYRKSHHLYFSALFITNVMTQDSLLMICGADDVISRISYAKDSDREVFELPKIVSRKKQLIPYLSALLKD